MFSFSIIFGITFYLSLIISRLCELKLLKYFRSKGRNSRTVVFVGNDPAVSEMYKTMTEDPSAGYIVKESMCLGMMFFSSSWPPAAATAAI